MNSKNLFRALCTAAMALVWASACVHAQTTPPVDTASAAPQAFTAGDGRQGTFKTVQGEVAIVQGAQRRAAQPGDPIREGDRVVAGPRSAAAVTLRDGTVLSIGPDTTVDLAQFQFDSTTEEGHVLVALIQGSLRMVTGLIAKLRPEQVKVTTPTTVIGVRGTDFIVEQKP